MEDLLKEYGCDNLCNFAASKGKLDVLKWAYYHGCLIDVQVCASAARIGHFGMLKWLHKHGCEWNRWVCENAAESGRLDILKWARKRGCPWDADTCSRAALKGHLSVLKWARKHGCPWNESTVYEAIRGGHLHIIMWIKKHQCPCAESNIFYFASVYGKLNIFKWAMTNCVYYKPLLCVELAARNGHSHIIQWILDNGDIISTLILCRFIYCYFIAARKLLVQDLVEKKQRLLRG
jgi:hypothetical protein